MTPTAYQIRQLTEEITPPESGKQNLIVADDAHKKVVLLAFAAGAGLPEHSAPLPAVILVLSGEGEIQVGTQKVQGSPGTWIQMEPKTSHAIVAKTPLRILLTLFKASGNPA